MCLLALRLWYSGIDLGKHKCPRQKVKGEFETSYNNQYKNFSIVPQIYKQNHRYE